jgi:MFS family permease
MGTTARTAVRRLATGRVISLTGGTASFLALNYTIYDRTGSAAWLAAALVLTFGTVGFVSPFSGMLGDRFDRKLIMIGSDLVGAGFFLAMAFVDAPGLLLGLAFCAAVAESPFLSASSAAVPNLVGKDQLGWANGLIALGRNMGILLGPLVGGLLLGWLGPGSVFAINGISFVLSALLIWSIEARFSDARTSDGELNGFRVGFRFLIGDVVLRTLALSWLALVLGLGMTMVADVPLVRLFDTGSWGYGVLISFWGAGSILGSLGGRWLRAGNEVAAFVVGTFAVAVASILIGLAPWFVMVLAVVMAMGIGDGVSGVAQQGVMQRRTPDAIRSRVSGAFESVVHVGLALSFAAGGGAVAWLGPRGVYLAGGVAALFGAAIAVPLLRRREAEEPEELGEAEPVPIVELKDPAALIVE